MTFLQCLDDGAALLELAEGSGVEPNPGVSVLSRWLKTLTPATFPPQHGLGMSKEGGHAHAERIEKDAYGIEKPHGLIVIVVIWFALVGRDAPRDPDAVIEVVVALVRVGGTHRFELSCLRVGEHTEVVVAQVAGAGVGHLKGDGEVEHTCVAEIEVSRPEMHRRAAAHTVVAVLVVAFHLIGRVEQGLLEIDAETVAEIAEAALHEDAAVGIGTHREQFAHLSPDMEPALVDIEQRDTTRAADNLAIDGGDAFAEDVDTVALHPVADDEVDIGSEEPVRLGLVGESAANIMGNTIHLTGIESGQLERVCGLKHGYGNRVFHNVFRWLRRNAKHHSHQKKKHKSFAHNDSFFIERANDGFSIAPQKYVFLRAIISEMLDNKSFDKHNNYNESVFPNGIRLIHKEKKGEIAHLVLMVETGTRDELAHQNGLAHFVEHTIFKGTQNRKAYHILSCLDNVGGDLNAFTTKEETCIQASFLKQHYKRALGLFADIAFRSTFPENELAKEKEVILDEINSYLDSPSDEIYDLFEEMVFKGHPLSRNILGTTELVKSFKRDDILDFMAHNYSTDQMILATVGDISFKEFERLAMTYFGNQPAHVVSQKREAFKGYNPEIRTLERNNHLSHCIIGGTAPEYGSPLRMPIVMLNNVLGGPAMSSRLGLNIREKYGFAYTIESQYTAYSDVGLINVYMAVDPDSLDKAIELVHKELEKLCTQKLGTLQLHHAKQQLIGQAALGLESGMTELLSATRSLLMGEPIEYMDEIIRNIEAVSANDILEVANRVFDRGRLSRIVFLGERGGK